MFISAAQFVLLLANINKKQKACFDQMFDMIMGRYLRNSIHFQLKIMQRCKEKQKSNSVLEVSRFYWTDLSQLTETGYTNMFQRLDS